MAIYKELNFDSQLVSFILLHTITTTTTWNFEDKLFLYQK